MGMNFGAGFSSPPLSFLLSEGFCAGNAGVATDVA